MKAAFIKSMEDGRTLQDTLREIRSCWKWFAIPVSIVEITESTRKFTVCKLRLQNVATGAVTAALKRRQTSVAIKKQPVSLATPC